MAFSEHAIVNFAAEPSTSTVVAPAAPAGMPAVFKGRNFARSFDDGGAFFGCSFDGAPARAIGGESISSTLFRCEMPPGGATYAAVLPVGSTLPPGGGSSVRQDAAWDPVPWVGIIDIGPGTALAASEAGGAAFTFTLMTGRA